VLRYRKDQHLDQPDRWMFGLLRPVGQPRGQPARRDPRDANLISFEAATGTRSARASRSTSARLLGPVHRAGLHHARRTQQLLRCELRRLLDVDPGRPEMLFGWHWTFDSGLNVAAAFAPPATSTSRTTSTATAAARRSCRPGTSASATRSEPTRARNDQRAVLERLRRFAVPEEQPQAAASSAPRCWASRRCFTEPARVSAGRIGWIFDAQSVQHSRPAMPGRSAIFFSM